MRRPFRCPKGSKYIYNFELSVTLPCIFQDLYSSNFPYMPEQRPRLQQGLDRDILRIVRGGSERSVPAIYSTIRSSNTALSRRPKRILEDSIERALDFIAQEAENAHIPSPMNEKSTPTSTLNPSASSSTKRRTNGELPPAKRKATAISYEPPTHVKLEDLGGVGPVIRQLKELIALPLRMPKLFSSLNIRPTQGVLLFGPPGCGKTMIANAFAAKMGVPFISISAPSIVCGISGESEKALREHFEEAKRLAPCLVFIDEVDAICPKRENAQREMEKRIVAQLLTCMDDLALEKTDGRAVIIIAATNRPDSLDPALRRAGRFDQEINLGVPNQQVREQILRKLTRQLQLTGDFDFDRLAQRTPGWVGADLAHLVSTAGNAAMRRITGIMEAEADDMDIGYPDTTTDEEVKQLDRFLSIDEETLSDEVRNGIAITFQDFLDSIPKIQPSAKREGFTTIPNTTWKDIGALSEVRASLDDAVIQPILDPQRYESQGLSTSVGVLLWGPPGCGKTLLAKAVANESQTNFISVKGPELLNKYVGESEKAIRQVFERARSSIPCILFFDEIDALAPARKDSLSESVARVVNTLLTELDGLESRKGIYVIGATNRPEMIDPAMLRTGRLEQHLLIDLPNKEERLDILRTVGKKYPHDFAPYLADVAAQCENFSGADLAGLIREAVRASIKRGSDKEISSSDFEYAKKKFQPNTRDLERYQRLKEEWGTGT